LCASLCAQEPPPTDLAGRPFFITKTWIVGGVGDWDYMAMDPVARRLFIAHGAAVQVIDVALGTVAGTISGLRQAHSVVLDQEGVFGYITDGPAADVKVFDRRSLQVVARIPTGPAPRAAALDAQTKLLFVIGSQALQVKAPGSADARSAQARPGATSPATVVTVIDTEARKQLAQIALTGYLGFAQADGNGQVYVTVSDRNQILRIDAQAIGSALQRMQRMSSSSPQSTAPEKTSDRALVLDWTNDANPAPPTEVRPRSLFLGGDCKEPRALAIDAAHRRLFASCANRNMVVVNGDNGQTVASVPIGPDSGGIAYDAERGLIFSANGGGDGSLTIVRQDVTDSYSVIQILPTRQRAKTIAVNSSNGEVYLASVIYGADLTRPPVNGAPVKLNAVDSSFQVLVVGN
jgi:DNA-binding beta-propeller fold protein YncE